jgi:hypothetical protein
VSQEEYEREHRIGFSLERIAKEIGRSGFGTGATAEALAEHRHKMIDGLKLAMTGEEVLLSLPGCVG